MGLKRWLTNRAVHKALEKRYKLMNEVRPTNDKKTTVLGVILATLIATKIDYTLLAAGDLSQIGMAVGALVTAVLGFYINRQAKG